MAKIRIHELAKKLAISNQELLNRLNSRGIFVKSHSSNIDDGVVMKILQTPQESSSKPKTLLRRRKDTVDGVTEKDKLPENNATISSISDTISNIAANLNSNREIVKALEVDVEKKSIDENSSQFSHFNTPQTDNKKPLVLSQLDHDNENKKNLAAGNSTDQATTASLAHFNFITKPSTFIAHNVVRMIDPNAIRARLAQENRTFKPRNPIGKQKPFTVGSATRSFSGGIRPPGAGENKLPFGSRPGFSTIREMRTKNQGFNSAYKPNQSANQKTLSRSNKKVKKENHSFTNKDRAEMGSGGYELWSQNNKKKKNNIRSEKTASLIQTASHKRIVELSGSIIVNDLAHQMSVKASQLVTKLMTMGMMVTANQPIDPDTAAIIANEFNYETKNKEFAETSLLNEIEDTPDNLLPRLPVVTIMGHVDHGKTSVLDAIKETHVAAGEAGGITQHIGAYTVKTKKGSITFLDTPGHEAFTKMRARGAKITDIVVLIVAADDGIMPQTIEAINHAKAANVPIIVAINKIDLPSSKPDRVLQQISEYGIVPEEWGGDVQVFRVSALRKIGLSELLDGILTLADMMELKANYSKPSIGTILEAKLDKGRGPATTVLVQGGTLKKGDYIVAGEYSGRIRAMYDSDGAKVEKAIPSMAIQILGLSGVPMAGDKFNVIQDEKTAKIIADHRAMKNREQELLKFSRVTLENFLQNSLKDKCKILRLIIKADVYGSIEALGAAVQGLSTKLVTIEIVHSGIGTITENDVNLAIASKAIIIGFNVKPDSKAHILAMQEKVNVRYYNIIYTMLDEIRLAMAGLLSPVVEEHYLGRAEIRVIFPMSKFGKISGCYVLDGKIIRSGKIRIMRSGKIIHICDIENLKRFKDDIKEIASGYEFGIALSNFQNVEIGDILECFEVKHVAAKLDLAIKDI